ncbi:MAG: M1 family metallopeptidase, partial [Vicinamibacterales bacterium]
KGRAAAWLLLAGAAACGAPPSEAPPPSSATSQAAGVAAVAAVRDTHSYARPEEARVTHVALDLAADFRARVLNGTATLTIERAPGATSVVLDSKDLEVSAVRTTDGRPLDVSKGPVDPILGQPLTIALPEGVTQVVVAYATRPAAASLQWLEPSQTAGKRHPFLYSQGQAILTRTWIPTQDSPGIRQTYDARITAPKPLHVLMSAEAVTPDGTDAGGNRVFEFRLTQPVPPYLIALAIGDLSFRPLGPRTGVFAEPSVVEAAASEFGELEQMVEAAERLLGSYRWGRYDVLVLPPSFAFGGMENPRVTFATPTVLAGDRSLVSLLAHELAHSWSGNLVTNATWRDFWLNEGVTTYVENRIMEVVYGPERAAMLRVLEHRELMDEIQALGGPSAPGTVLHIDLAGRDPDEGATSIPYNKGSALLRLIERTFGRERFDVYLRSYFDRFAFQPITTERFLADVRQHLVAGDPAKEADLRLDEWAYRPGLPDNVPLTESDVLEKAAAAARAFGAGTAAASLATAGWSTQEWQHFLNSLPVELSRAQLEDLDRTFRLSERGNAEVLFLWLRVAIRHHYQPAMPALERFLTTQGRRKFVAPLFQDLMMQPWGRADALRIYAKARPLYHAVSRTTVDGIVK